MKMVRASIVVILGLGAGISAAGDFKAGSEPDGFRGIKWGTKLSEVPGMELVSESGAYGAKTYSKRGEDLTLDSIKVEEILYKFWLDKLISVKIYARGRDNCMQLKGLLFEKFGAVGKDEFPNQYFWTGEKTTAEFEYDEFSQVAALSIWSKELMAEMENWLMRKPEGGADAIR